MIRMAFKKGLFLFLETVMTKLESKVIPISIGSGDSLMKQDNRMIMKIFLPFHNSHEAEIIIAMTM